MQTCLLPLHAASHSSNLRPTNQPAGSSDTAIRIWLVDPHSAVAKPERAESELKGHSDYVTALQWKPTNSDVLASTASSDKDKSVRFWDVRTSKCTSVLNMSSGGNVSLAWAPDGNQLAVANNKVRVGAVGL